MEELTFSYSKEFELNDIFINLIEFSHPQGDRSLSAIQPNLSYKNT